MRPRSVRRIFSLAFRSCRSRPLASVAPWPAIHTSRLNPAHHGFGGRPAIRASGLDQADRELAEAGWPAIRATGVNQADRELAEAGWPAIRVSGVNQADRELAETGGRWPKVSLSSAFPRGVDLGLGSTFSRPRLPAHLTSRQHRVARAAASDTPRHATQERTRGKQASQDGN